MKQQLVERELTEEGPRRFGQPPSRRRRSATVNLAESPLGWLYARGYLDDRQFVRASGCAPTTNAHISRPR